MYRILMILMLLVGAVSAENFTITFKDSTQIEETYIASNATQINYGRVQEGSANRAIFLVGPNFSNEYRALFRIVNFYDSVANHSGAIIDSGKLVVTVNAPFGATSGDSFYVRAVGIDTNRNWGEGNSNGATAANCEVGYDSCQNIGGGACATAQDWGTDGAKATTDTIGLYTGKPSDSTFFDADVMAAGDQLTFWVDTVTMNLWKDYSYANEGFILMWSTKSGNIDFYPKIYASESNTLTSISDSIPVFTLYGHTAAAATGQTIIISDKDAGGKQ